jgi:hypothetical protein
VQLVFSGCVTPPLLFFQRVVITPFCLTTFAMRQFSFSSVLVVPAFRSIGGKLFLTQRTSAQSRADR